jgi:hypothetical protein
MTGAIATMVTGTDPILNNRSLSSVVPNTENALVQLTFQPQGYLQTTEGGGGGVVTNRLPEWWGHAFIAGYNCGIGFQIRCDVSSGNAPNAGSLPTGTWFNLDGVPRDWLLFQNAVGTLTGVWVIQIRVAATGAVLATASYTMTATKNP